MSRLPGFDIEPLYDHVLVRRDEIEETASGLSIPKSLQGRASTGTVVACGAGWTYDGKLIPTQVEAGDRVYVREFGGTVVNYKGENLYIFRVSEIVGKIVEPLEE